jgi:hypothetical protein
LLERCYPRGILRGIHFVATTIIGFFADLR